jgi:alpha-ribazole phosphatase
MAGRRDVDADCSNLAAIEGARARLTGIDRLILSPAQRCQQTARALWPDRTGDSDPRLWEQDFGLWEGMAYGDLPDLGPLTAAQLAAHRPPNGESFNDLCARATPALLGHAGRVAMMVHAGIIRAALGLALGRMDAGLAFQIAPLSVSKIVILGDGQFAISYVNWTL